MKRSILTLAIFLFFSHMISAQSSHLSLIYDFDGQNYDYSVKGMVGTNDSLYVICNTPDGRGFFFRIDENGEGYEVIWEFDAVNGAPSSLISNGTIIYGTTRFSANGGGTLFKYSLQDYSFEFVKDFDYQEVMEVQIKYLTDSVLWLSSQWSAVDEGSIFIMNPNGTGLHKIYNDTNEEKGQNPVDFIFHEGKIYIACYGGGGTPTPNGDGTFTSTGSFIRINADGTGYENIIPGGPHVGTAPQSLIIRENKLFGQFAYSNSGNQELGGQFFRSNLDGTEYDSLGAVSIRALTKMLSTDSLIYGIGCFNIVGINPTSGEIRIFDDLLSEPDFGWDVTSNPAFLNGHVFITAQQGGPNEGGTILKWTNQDPEVYELYFNALQNAEVDIDLNELFTDPEGDFLTFNWEYDEAAIAVAESNGVLTLTALIADPVHVKITAADGWAGRKTVNLALNPDGTVTFLQEQLISFSEISSKTYGDSPFELEATSSSGLPITYTSSNAEIAAITGTQVSILRAGTVTITAAQSGNESYQAAESTQVLTIHRANQTINFELIADKNSDETSFELEASASSNLEITFVTDDTEFISIIANEVFILGPGVATITANQPGNENYEASEKISRTFTINLVTANEEPTATVEVYPNPSSDVIRIQSDNLISSVSITHTSGKTEAFEPWGNEINIQHLAPGLYILRFKEGEILHRKKIVIE